ncbi:hypothetical protein Q31b_50650 [Novipirellula aureliae]|uniref:Uncharacterized protein n=1 Tax=Novipirellula aureliae TaxID=2527966 RepID=A0A5C6DFT2_9BACT|nr:hypothetical protein [Novipirellula aureliae]TWU35630.1 hypothetical protein Q31b_50650 [Novipirellula aureliae]
MQKPEDVLDSYFLEARCHLLEIAAVLDRHDRACEDDSQRSSEARIDLMYESLAMLSQRGAAANRSERLLLLFSEPE